MWDSFITSFCKVEFLCYAGEPNWLGWVPIGIIGMILFIIGGVIVTVVFSWFDDED